MDSKSERQLKALRIEIAERLANVCSGWEPDVFDALVTRIALITFKYELRAALNTRHVDKASTTRLIDEISNWADESGLPARPRRYTPDGR